MTQQIDYAPYIRWGAISDVERDGARLMLRIERVHRHGLVWAGTLTFEEVTCTKSWDPRSHTENDARLEPGWSLDGLVWGGRVARLQVSKPTGPGETIDAVFIICCNGVRPFLRPSVWRTLVGLASRI